MPLPPVPDFLTLTFRPDLNVLLVRWQRLISVAEMQQGYLVLLEYAAEHGCRHWLLDGRRRFNTDREGAQWMLSTFLPQLQPRLHQRTYLAYLLAPVNLRDQDADAAFPPATYFGGKPFLAERFVEEGEAVRWLQQQP
ncbi:hypothetical protein [Hymenobacter cellulosilyticus]|uniref:STAS/SEC14 domain-containing protein n=1 Tax=Hymenobacter cellulosilyticus TaxID=2932248 RepID=A0A8T9QBS7_9BACT|nr:hypothetical protein [Hymenobacter cellulosilyticus]UOQ73280.1 hypothetical protein MUN79_04735 [Hymenobacter cellulosilyticus]